MNLQKYTFHPDRGKPFWWKARLSGHVYVFTYLQIMPRMCRDSSLRERWYDPLVQLRIILLVFRHCPAIPPYPAKEIIVNFLPNEQPIWRRNVKVLVVLQFLCKKKHPAFLHTKQKCKLISGEKERCLDIYQILIRTDLDGGYKRPGEEHLKHRNSCAYIEL